MSESLIFRHLSLTKSLSDAPFPSSFHVFPQEKNLSHSFLVFVDEE